MLHNACSSLRRAAVVPASAAQCQQLSSIEARWERQRTQ